MENSGPANASTSAITVTQLNRQVRALLEQGVGRIWIEGEISNLARPASGHIYFSLKDEGAQVRAAWFRQRQRGPAARLADGDKVLVFARVSLYEPRGDYQLIVEQLEPAGEGALRRQFEVLRKKLAAEGLFAEEHKQALPDLPRRIGVITSPTGAAVRDILTVLRRRFPSIPVLIYPAAVQGDAAAPELTAALQTAIRRDECDVLIIGRGGGSLEDLQAFNDEALARAIFASPIPVVSAVGHEVDITIADFVADARAPTPSGAAEIVVPSSDDWLRAINAYAVRIARLARRTVEDRAQSLDWLARRLVQASPQATLKRQEAHVLELGRRLGSAMRRQTLSLRPRLVSASQRLTGAGRGLVGDARHRLALAIRSLNSVSPLSTLDRGYAIVEDLATGKVLTDAGDTAAGRDIRARLASGELVATVQSVKRKR